MLGFSVLGMMVNKSTVTMRLFVVLKVNVLIVQNEVRNNGSHQEKKVGHLTNVHPKQMKMSHKILMKIKAMSFLECKFITYLIFV